MRETAKRLSARRVLICALCALLLTLLPWEACLSISRERGTPAPAVLPLEPGETFSLRFTHSVNLSDVTDELQWTGRELILRSSLFTSFGAGMPIPAEGEGQTLTNTPEGFWLGGLDRPQPGNGFLLMTQSVPNHRLLYRGREINLLERYGPGSLLRVRVRRVSLWERLLFSL